MRVDTDPVSMRIELNQLCELTLQSKKKNRFTLVMFWIQFESKIGESTITCLQSYSLIWTAIGVNGIVQSNCDVSQRSH